MKTSYIKLFCLLIFMTLALLYSAFVHNVFADSNLIYGIFIAICFGVSFLLVGLEKEEKNRGLDIFRKVFVYTLVYLMLIYILGLMIGFVRNPYSLELTKIISNIGPLLIIIIFEELLRFNMIKKLERKKKLIIFVTLMFIAIEIIRSIGLYSFSTGMDIFEVIGLLILPAIARNGLFSYINYRGYYKVNILYKFLITLNVYFLPIYPDLGIYLESIFNIILPTLVFLSVNSLYYEQKLIFKKEIRISQVMFVLPSTVILLVSVILTSGIFQYFSMSVGSGSMYPAIKVGDAIIVEKVDTEKIKKGDVLVHRHEGKVILHRVIRVVEKSKETCYYTKGDANPSEDGYEICKNDIYGIVVGGVPFVGYPSVWIEQFSSNK